MKKRLERNKRISTSYIEVNPRKCIACWKCINNCPKQVIGKVSFLWHKHILIENSNACCGCHKCVITCSQGVFYKL